MSYNDNDPKTMREYINQAYFIEMKVIADSPYKGYSRMPALISMLNRVTDEELRNHFTESNTKALAGIRNVSGVRSCLWGCDGIAQRTINAQFGDSASVIIGDETRRGKAALVFTSLDVLNAYEDNLRRNIEVLINRSL
jgi:hypothetical protein